MTTVGFSYRPIPQVVLELDSQAILGSPLDVHPRGPRENPFNTGLGWMFQERPDHHHPSLSCRSPWQVPEQRFVPPSKLNPATVKRS